MPINFNVDKAIDLYFKDGGDTQFKDGLRQILEYSTTDKGINDVRELAYLLATAEAESDYSLQRWESDYLCGTKGVPYSSQPCNKALAYYGSTLGGKQNYYDLGTDSRGLPYFGRGLIQLTGKSNYDTYGRLIGLGGKLVDNPELALNPKISYEIAVAYMNKPKGSAGKSVFDYVKENNLTMARKLVNGGTKGIGEVNREYNRWLSVLKDSDLGYRKRTLKMSEENQKAMGFSLITMSIVAFAFGYWYFSKVKN